MRVFKVFKIKSQPESIPYTLYLDMRGEERRGLRRNIRR